jgi:hypothetical protein
MHSKLHKIQVIHPAASHEIMNYYLIKSVVFDFLQTTFDHLSY